MMNQQAEIEHCYGPNIHILNNAFLLGLLAKFCHASTKQPILNSYIELLYSHLLSAAVNSCFEQAQIKSSTRMSVFTDKAVFQGSVPAPDSRAIVVDLARAGIFPGHLCFEYLHYLLTPENLRQDHFYLNRKTNEKDEVIGVNFAGSKIGGPKDDAYLFIPDPMGATGSSLSYVITHYKEKVKGTAKKFIALHLIITPEYIERMKTDHPDLEIFAIRLDRGLSTEKALQATPGKYPLEERGLNDKQYIVPGAGGIGEILNNSFV